MSTSEIEVDNGQPVSSEEPPKHISSDEDSAQVEYKVLQKLGANTNEVLRKFENIKLNTTASPSDLLDLPLNSLPADMILSYLEQLLAAPLDTEDEHFILPEIDSYLSAALISRSIIPYLEYLDQQRLNKITLKVYNDTTKWIANLFKFTDSFASYHIDPHDSLVRALRLAIVSKFPKFNDDGLPKDKVLKIYGFKHNSAGLNFACRSLGLPVSTICIVNNTTDVIANVSSDLSKNQTPLFIIADIASNIDENLNDLISLHETCETHGIWLHCKGHNLAALAVTPNSFTLRKYVDSINLTLGNWIGIRGLPDVLLHRPIENTVQFILEMDPISRRLNSLSWWIILQMYGKASLIKRIKSGYDLCFTIYKILSKIGGLKILNQFGMFENDNETWESFVGRFTSTVDFIRAINSSIIFQLNADSIGINVQNFLGEDATATDIDINAVYFEKLNTWLGQILQRDCPYLDLEIVDHPLHGICISYCPLDLNAGKSIPTDDQLIHFADMIEMQVDISAATVKHKATLPKLIQEMPNLKLVVLPEWAGLGGVRFIPIGWQNLNTDYAKSELNKLNIAIVDALRMTDSAFSMGEGADGLVCIRFGMVTEETEISELLDLVASIGDKIQEDSKMLDSMAEIVKKGIETAEADLKRETEEKIWADGVLRYIPVVGGFVNWWSPPSAETGIKGRTLNLAQGVIESTENTYKYHMQAKDTIAATTKPNKQPINPQPTTSVDTEK